MDFSLPAGFKKAEFHSLYSELELYRALVKAYVKPLFSWRKALSMSHDNRTLYDFARHTSQNAAQLHSTLKRNKFHFREGLELHYNFNGKKRTIYIFPWEERIVDRLLYSVLTRYFHNVFSNHSYAYRLRDFGVDFCQHRIRRIIAAHKDTPLFGFKRDIADYFPSVNHDILIHSLKEWIEPDDYLSELLNERVKFKIKTETGQKTAEKGIPFGTAISCFFANFYLTALDKDIAKIKDVSYFRYADDILVLSSNRDAVIKAIDCLNIHLNALKLESNPKHHLDFCLTNLLEFKDDVFEHLTKIRHLGLEYTSSGDVRLSRDKFRKICNLFKFAFRRAKRKLCRLVDPLKRAALLIDISKTIVERGFRSVAIIDYYLKHVKDENQLKQLDRWLAEEVLAEVFQNGHKKGNFRKLPFDKLREMGLPSLVHRRRLILHRNIESSFFVLRTNKLIEKEKGRLSGRWTFSPCLKAPATNACGKERRL